MRIPENLIRREQYLNKIIPFINTSLIKVLTGQRRVGKSYLLYQVIEYVQSIDEKAQIIYINMEDLTFDFLKTAKDLNDYVLQNIHSDVKNYLFIDEIQDVPEFEKALRSLLLLEQIDIFITGSNAKMLSGELASYLSGRYIEINVFSLSYIEFLEFHGLNDAEDSFLKYMKYGGLPYIKNLPLTDDLIFDYLKNIYNTIIYRDVVSRYNLRNTRFLENLVKFLASNIGNIFSAKKISDFLKSQRVNISTPQIQNYIEYLKSAYIISAVGRYDIVGKKFFEIGDKFYFENLGIRNAIVGFKSNEIANILENIVYNHLLFCGYDVKVGVLRNLEIDFIAERNHEKVYIQVALHLNEKSTEEREFGNLTLIKDNYPKYVITLDPYAGNTYEGIKHLTVRQFLLSDF